MTENIYSHYRNRASITNPALRSRANASEILGISESSLSNYETGKTKVVPPEMVAQMATAYNAPELRNIYCISSCPLGSGRHIATCEAPAEKIAVHLVACMMDDEAVSSVKKFVRMADSGIDNGELASISVAFGRIGLALSEFEILAEREGAVQWS